MRASVAAFSAILFAAVVGAIPQTTNLNNPGNIVEGGSNNDSDGSGNFVGACDVGTQMCCDSVQTVDDSIMAKLSDYLSFSPSNKMFGTNCSPQHGDASDNNTCTASPACCEAELGTGGLGGGVFPCKDFS